MKSRQGSVLVEGALCAGLVVLAVTLQIELVRRASLEILLRHGVFLKMRSLVFGSSDPKVPLRFWADALGEERAQRLLERTRFESERFDGVLRSEVFTAYPSFLKFPWKEGIKHSFEVTRRCRFSLSP